MMIMALDHVRDLMHINSITQSPTNLETTTPVLFFTRWVTYLCAPTFVFLAGTSAYLFNKKTNGTAPAKSFLLKRGFYLIVLDLIVVNFILFFDPAYHTVLFEVIAAIGFGFIVIALLLNAPVKLAGSIGLLILFCHDLISFLPPQSSVLKNILQPLFSLDAFPVFSNKVIVIAYPPLSWLGIMLTGFASGKFFEMQSQKRRRLFMQIGLCALFLFIGIRFLNIYGDPLPWLTQKNALFTFLSFMNVTKYPPSLLFCLITLGIMFIMLSIAESKKNPLFSIASVYGKIPLFYFLVHFLLIHLIMLAVMLLQGFSWAQLDFASGNFGRPKGVSSGVPLWAIYLIWTTVVVALYFPCRWYGKYKAEHKQWWLKYM